MQFSSSPFTFGTVCGFCMIRRWRLLQQQNQIIRETHNPNTCQFWYRKFKSGDRCSKKWKTQPYRWRYPEGASTLNVHLTNQEMTERIFVLRSTVKKYLKNIEKANEQRIWIPYELNNMKNWKKTAFFMLHKEPRWAFPEFNHYCKWKMGHVQWDS